MTGAPDSRESGARAVGGLAVGAVRRSFAPWQDPSAVPLIRFENVTRRFGAVTAVDDVDLAIYPRELFCLLGASGCGKTTLMRMLAGFERPDEGRIWLDGVDITEQPPHLRPVNMMFQSYALFPHLSVADNIAFGLKQERLDKAVIAGRVARMLDLVQLKGFERRRPHELSGGQRQRVALARALAKQPKVLLLDEPLGALDRKTREETQFELMDIQMELGATFLVVTHDQDEAMVMADRIAVMEKGRLAQIGTPAEVYEQPATRNVADFVGDINLFTAVIAEPREGGGMALAVGGLGLFRVEPPALAVTAGQSVTLALRPEKMALTRPGQAAPFENTMPGVIFDIGYLGDWTVFLVKLTTGQVVRVTRANAQRRVSEPLSWDDPVTLSFPPDAAVVLTR